MSIEAQVLSAAFDIGRNWLSKISSREAVVTLIAIAVEGYIGVECLAAGATRDASFCGLAIAATSAALVWGLSWRKGTAAEGIDDIPPAVDPPPEPDPLPPPPDPAMQAEIQAQVSAFLAQAQAQQPPPSAPPNQ